MTKRILVIDIHSGYNILSIFLEELSKGFETFGYEVELFKADTDFILSHLLDKPFSEYEFVFCINSGILDEYEFASSLPATTPFVSYMVDHPIYHYNRINNACLSYLITNVSRERVRYAATYYKNINKNKFIPHGGSKATVDIPFENRKYDVTFLGGYTDPNRIQEEMNALPKGIIDFNTCIVDFLVSDETMSWGTAIELTCAKYGLNPGQFQLNNLARVTVHADRLFRAYTRELLIKTLIRAGVRVDVFGTGWEAMACDHREYLTIHEPVDYSEALNIMADSRIVLNCAISLNTGSHERIFSAMANGAVCVTNYSSYLKKAGLEELVVPYSIYELDKLPHKIRNILNNPSAVREITAKAQKCVLKNHMWRNRAEEIISMVENYKKECHYEKVHYENQVDMQFGELCRFIKENTYELLLEKMKGVIYSLLNSDKARMETILKYYNCCGRWGGCEPEKEHYELLENRAKALKEHLPDFVWMKEHLSDKCSVTALYGIMRHWLDYFPGHLTRIKESVYDPYFDENIISCTKDEVLVDLGVNVGDTVCGYLKNYSGYKRIYCYDISEEKPNLCREDLELFQNIEYHRCKEDDKLCLDQDIAEPITFLKMDIGGNNQKTLVGARNHIIRNHPKLAISICHNNEDIWKIGKMIYEMDHTYQFYMRYYGESLYPNKCVLYAI